MSRIEEYYKDFEKLQEEFHENMHEYPLFEEMIDEIYEKDIKEINDLLEKNDEYYLKKAINKLSSINNYIQDTSREIDKLYKEYDKNAKIWNNFDPLPVTDEVLYDMNSRLKKANELINGHSIDELKEANRIMKELIKEASNLNWK